MKTNDDSLKGNLTDTKVGLHHNKVLGYMKKSTWFFDNSDIVECDDSLLDEEIKETIWKNIHLYSYDVLEKFFLKSFTFHLKNNGKLLYEMFFFIEDNSIFVFAKDRYGNDVVGATIMVEEGKFSPMGAISDKYYEIFKINHIEEKLPTDRQFIANRGALNCLLYVITINEMVNRNREIITQTSKRIMLPTKKSKSKKANHKKMKEIKYIRIDGVKIQRIKDEQNSVNRGTYERHTKEWSRRGHYRTYKNGKKVWIEPTTVRVKDDVEGAKKPKIYKVK